MDEKKKSKLIKIAQTTTVVVYVFLVLRSTVGKYIKETKKNIAKEAKRKDKINEAKYKKRLQKLKAAGKI